MKDEKASSGSTLHRRDFLKAGLQVTAGAVALGSGSALAGAPADKQITSTGKIPERVFGKTGHSLPVLGHGGSAMVESWAQGYGVSLGSVDERAAMVKKAFDLGVRYFDTARMYGESEAIMGQALEGVRDEVYLASKVADPRPEKVRASVETSLEQLRTSYLDGMQIHSPAIERVGYDGGMRMLEELQKLKAEGMIRFIGVTTHVVFETVYRMISTGSFDQVLLARGYLRKGMDMMLSNPNIEWREKCVAKAHELGMGIVAMKIMGLNMLGRGSHQVVAEYDPELRQKLPAAAIRWAMQDQRIGVMIIGMSVPEDIVANFATMTGDLTFTEEDQMLLADYSVKVYGSDYVKQMRVV